MVNAALTIKEEVKLHEYNSGICKKVNEVIASDYLILFEASFNAPVIKASLAGQTFFTCILQKCLVSSP